MVGGYSAAGHRLELLFSYTRLPGTFCISHVTSKFCSLKKKNTLTHTQKRKIQTDVSSNFFITYTLLLYHNPFSIASFGILMAVFLFQIERLLTNTLLILFFVEHRYLPVCLIGDIKIFEIEITMECGC